MCTKQNSSSFCIKGKIPKELFMKKPQYVVPEGHSKGTFPESLPLFSLSWMYILAKYPLNIQQLTCLNFTKF